MMLMFKDLFNLVQILLHTSIARLLVTPTCYLTNSPINLLGKITINGFVFPIYGLAIDPMGDLLLLNTGFCYFTL